MSTLAVAREFFERALENARAASDREEERTIGLRICEVLVMEEYNEVRILAEVAAATDEKGTEMKKDDEFAPHWSVILEKDGTLQVTFEIETTLKEIPDVALIELLRAAVVAQVGKTVALRLVVSGQEYRSEFSEAATVRTVIAQVIDATFNVGRRVDGWELRDADGREINPKLTLGAALSNHPNHDPLWLSPHAGVGA